MYGFVQQRSSAMQRVPAWYIRAGYALNWLDYIEFDGVHEFCKDDFPIRRLVEDIRK